MARLKEYFKYRPFKSKRILLVDDEEDLGWILHKIVHDAGHRLIFAPSLKEGMQKFRNSRSLDVAIIDLRIGNESGLAFIKKAKRINENVKLIMISAFGTLDVENRARRLGVHHFLHKPLKSERLLDIINRKSI